MKETILLYAQSEEVIRDVTASLKLVELDVSVAQDTTEVAGLLSERRYDLILSEFHPDSSGKFELPPEIRLSEDGGTQNSGSKRYALCTSNSISKLGESSCRFDGVLRLPVEFPKFTKEVVEILRGGGADKGSEQGQEPQGKAEAMNQQLSSDNAKQDPSVLSWHHKNLTVVYAIHDKVLEELRRVPNFNELSEENVGKLVLATTGAIVRQLRRES